MNMLSYFHQDMNLESWLPLILNLPWTMDIFTDFIIVKCQLLTCINIPDNFRCLRFTGGS